VENEDAELGRVTFPGVPYQMGAEAAEGSSNCVPTTRIAPRLSEHAGAGRSVVRPLEGLRILDFSWVMTGPICTKYLAALGAEVIKVESRARPDLSHRDVNWEELNPSKRSITLNLKHDRARDLARRLVTLSDVVVENFSTGVMERLGPGYSTL